MVWIGCGGGYGVGKPAVGRGVELPEFANLSALPPAHGGQDFFGRYGMGELIGECPAAGLGAVELEGVPAEGFGSGEAVRTRERAGQPFFEESQDGRRPRRFRFCPPRDGQLKESVAGRRVINS